MKIEIKQTCLGPRSRWDVDETIVFEEVTFVTKVVSIVVDDVTVVVVVVFCFALRLLAWLCFLNKFL